MIKQVLIYLSVIVLVVACGSGGPKKPKNLISKNDMVNILIDARLLSSANSASKDIMEQRGLKLDSYVFDKYGIDSLQFAESNTYYAYYIKDYEEIYNKVTDSLERLKTALNEQKIKEEKEQKKREKDSINALKAKDSLDVTVKKDSLTEDVLKKKLKKEEGVLISPASSMNRQSPI